MFAVFLQFGCSKDFYDEQINKSSKSYVINNVPIRELFEENKFSKAYDKISKIHPFSQPLSTSRTAFENEYGFTIVDIPANVIEYDGKTTYTLKIVKDSSQTNELDNLLIISDALNGSKSYLINYKLLPTTNEQATKVIDSNEPIIKYEIAFDPNASVSSKFSSDCIELIIIYCSDSNYYCGGTDTAHGCSQTFTISCGGGGSEIGSSPDSSGGNAGGGMLTSPVGTNPHGGAGGNSSTQPPQTPCETLSDAIQDPKVAQAIQALKPKTLTKFESAYEITRKYNLELQQYVYDTKLKGGDGFNATAQVRGYIKGNAHNHTIYAQSIPSIGDAHWSMECQQEISPTTAIGYNMVVCPNPVSPLDFETTLLYSLTVDNLTTLTSSIDAVFNRPDLLGKELDKKYEILNDEYGTKFAAVQNSSLGMEKKFLELYANFGLSLYKFDKDTNKWSKLVLQNNEVTEQPCEE